LSKNIYADELRAHFVKDTKRIDHAFKVLHYAELIMDGERVQEEMRKVITITAILHDVGIKAAEQKYNSVAGHYQEIEGPPIARAIMLRHGEPPEVMDRVAYIIGGHHTAAKNDGLDFQIIWEADLLVNIEEDGLAKGADKLQRIIDKNFLTVTGKSIAYKQYL
jgi:hypothetical protein